MAILPATTDPLSGVVCFFPEAVPEGGSQQNGNGLLTLQVMDYSRRTTCIWPPLSNLVPSGAREKAINVLVTNKTNNVILKYRNLMEQSILSSFSVRKSTRLSTRPTKCFTPAGTTVKKMKDLGKPISASEPRNGRAVSLIKGMLQKENSLSSQKTVHDLSECESNVIPKSGYFPDKNDESVFLKCDSQDSPQAISVSDISPECALKASLMVSPKKRKSDDENEAVGFNLSPVKTPRASPPDRVVQCHRTPIRSPVLNSPETPKSSKLAPIECKSTPRRLFGSPQKKVSESMASLLFKQKKDSYLTPEKNSPRKFKPVQLYKSEIHPYQSAKRSLHTAKPEFLVGREKEEAEIEKFVTDKIKQHGSGSMYISGAPGTGKTAVVSHILDSIKVQHSNVNVAFINCMMLKDSNTVFKQLLDQLGESVTKVKDAMKTLEKVFTSIATPVLLVLDEIDQLDSKHHHVLYQIFEWPTLPNSKLILIGIANALDLTDRILPRLQASSVCQPVLLNFPPYTVSQITEILKNRLQKECVLEPAAISFCARKISAVAGDARKALDVCHRAIELIESDVRGQQVLKPTDCNSPTKKHQTPVKKVSVMHISKVMSEVYGSSVQSANSGDHELPLQQKLAICSLLLLVKSGKFKEVPLGKLHETYSTVCKRQHVAPVDQGEFYSVLSLLDARGVMAMKKAKETRLIKISLKLDEHELEQTLKDKTLLAAILTDKFTK
ncbi:AAA ATPase [Bulinus truncatus]|nr:AAA ATPase [Bulinus truncatus]